MSKQKQPADRTLTSEERDLAARAYELARCVFERYARRYSTRSVDWSSEVAMRICLHIAHYDQRLGSLANWARVHANLACLDAMRTHFQGPRSRKKSNRVRVLSLDNPIGRDDNGRGWTHAGMVPARSQSDPDAVDAALALLRGLDHGRKYVVWESLVEGRNLKEIGENIGLSEGRVCQMRSEALCFLRDARRA